MRSIFGLHVTSRTTLSIRAALAGDTAAVMTIQRRSGGVSRVPGPGIWTASLEPGDYVVRVNDAVKVPVVIGMSGPTVVVTTVMTGVRAALAAFPASDLIVKDPKDPWPPALSGQGVELDAAAGGWFQETLLPAAGPSGRGDEAPDVHALLIGIDDYPAGSGQDLYRSCRGSVADALDAAAYLRELGVPDDRVTLLLSPATAAPGAAAATYDNLARAWRRLADEVPAGSQVYIHYSGHGGRARTRFPEVKGAAGLDEVLAPCDVNDRARGRYLRDIEIASLLERMSRRGLAVTLVVDSCNAGGITRGDAAVRAGDGDDLEARPAEERDSAVASAAELAETARRVATAAAARRDAGWFFGASPHVLVAACRQNELAHEHAFDGINPRGALTYFWLDALRGGVAPGSYRAAHQAASAALHAHFRDQSPVLIGDGDRLVLGTEHVARPRAIPITGSRDGRIELSAGQAHGLRVGARLAVLPPGALPELVDLGSLPVLEVDSVEPTSATARSIDAAGAGTASPPAGATAVVLSHGTSLTRTVRLLAPAAARSINRGGPGGPAVDRSLAAIEEAITADRSNLVGLAGEGSASYLVGVGDEPSPIYRVLDAGGAEVPNLGPPLAVADPDAAARLTARLVHLARFTSVLTLANHSAGSPLAGRLGMSIHVLPATYQDGDPIDPVAAGPAAADPIPHGGWFCLRIENRASVDVHVVVLDLQPDWGISRMLPGDASTFQLAPGQVLDTVARAWLPEGLDRGTDVLKAIATVAPTDYDWLLLDPLTGPLTGPIGEQDAAVGHRGPGRPPRGELEALMAAMARPERATRHVQQAPSSKWTTAMLELTVIRP